METPQTLVATSAKLVILGRVGDEDLKHIWPTRHAHINVYGRYYFNRDNVGKKQQLRELRQPGFQP
jgi:hypothetical protein